jgi:preprotein translocase subunit YajC
MIIVIRGMTVTIMAQQQQQQQQHNATLLGLVKEGIS